MLDAGERLSSYEPLWENWYKDEFIGGGSFGRVYRFKQNFFGEIRYCAVKIIPILMDQELNHISGDRTAYIEKKKAETVGEIKNMYRLEGKPNLVQCLAHSIRDIYDDYGSVIGFDILIQMHLYTPLMAYMRRNVILTDNQASCLAFQIGNALDAMHSIGMLHRDVKIDNIYVDDQGNYLLGDFGISKQDALGRGSTMAGTQPFIAPEVWNIKNTNIKYTRTADIYSYGITLYYLLNNNSLPLVREGMSHNEIDQAIFDRLGGKKFDPPANGSQRLKDIVMRCCEYEPQRRFQSFGEIIRALTDPSYNITPIPKPSDSYATVYAETPAEQNMYTGGSDSFATQYADKQPSPAVSQTGSMASSSFGQIPPANSSVGAVSNQGAATKKKNSTLIIFGTIIVFAVFTALTLFLLNMTKGKDSSSSDSETAASSDPTQTTEKKTTEKTTETTTTTSQTTAKPADTTTQQTPSQPSENGRVNTAEIHGVESTERSKNTIKIMCPNTEFKNYFDALYAKGTKYHLETENYTNEGGNVVSQITSIDGKRIEWIQYSTYDNIYQNALTKALNEQKNSTDKIDMFLVDIDYASLYTDSRDSDNSGLCTLSIQDLGFTDDDTKNMFKYTLDAVRDPISGDVKGVTWQVTSGLFYYDVKMAREVLGTDDPNKVQQFVKDWDSFEDTAVKLKNKGYCMLSSYSDSFRVFESNMSAAWVVDNTLRIDPQMEAWVNQTKKFTENGWNTKTDLWTQEWMDSMKNDTKVFGFFMPSWGVKNCLESYGGKETAGKWRACPGPASWYWGGTFLCGAIDSDNQDIVADIMKVMTCNKNISLDLFNKYGQMVNNKEAIKQLSGTYKNSYLGGQNILALMAESADKINLKGKSSAYNYTCLEKFQSAMSEYYKGTSSYDECLRYFKNEIKKSYPSLNV